MTGYANLAGGGYSYATQDGTVTFAGYIANGLGALTIPSSPAAVSPLPPALQETARKDLCITHISTPTTGPTAMHRAVPGTTPGSNINQEDPSKFNYVSEDKLYDFAQSDNDVVVIHIGDNDHDGRNGSTGSNADSFISYMKKFIKQVRSVNPRAEIHCMLLHKRIRSLEKR